MSTSTSIYDVTKVKLVEINGYKDKKGVVWCRCHNLICTDKNGIESEIKIYGENGKELITSLNGKRANNKIYDHKGKLEKES